MFNKGGWYRRLKKGINKVKIFKMTTSQDKNCKLRMEGYFLNLINNLPHYLKKTTGYITETY